MPGNSLIFSCHDVDPLAFFSSSLLLILKSFQHPTAINLSKKI